MNALELSMNNINYPGTVCGLTVLKVDNIFPFKL